MSSDLRDERIRRRLVGLYGDDEGARAAAALFERLDQRRPANAARPRFDETHTVLISYGDGLLAPGRSPLGALGDFAQRWLRDAFSHIHLLPFFPSSSDDGFSVIDFQTVDAALGNWSDVEGLREAGFSLVFDFVLNHISAQSPWFARYLAGDEAFAELAIKADPRTDLSQVVRPRALPLLTPFTRGDGQVAQLWTTFSADQVDLNYQNPDVLLRMIDVMLAYADRGATMLRLDAVGFLYKRVGSSCMHLPQTHEVIRLFRDILDRVAPQVSLLTETNVPHAENISYFGDGFDEAQLVYNFSLPPLLLAALHRGDGTALTTWAASLASPSDATTFFNFTASHDGIGVRPLEGLVPDAVIDDLAALARARGGRVSMRHGRSGQAIPYELNVTYVDALRGTDDEGGDTFHVARVLASQAIALALPGVPAVYLGTLLGHRNWQAGVTGSGQARAINRQKVPCDAVEAELARRGSFREQVFSGITQLLALRRRQPAFSPNACAVVHQLHPGVLALERQSSHQRLLALTNLRDRPCAIALPQGWHPTKLDDLLDPQSSSSLEQLAPYQTRWLTARLGR